MIMQERPPALGWRPPTLCHVFGDRGLSDIDAELKESTVNAWCAPERICDTHARMSSRVSCGVPGRPPCGRDLQRQ
jgi:hypothetical protein